MGTYMFRKIRGKEYDFFSLGTQYLLQCCAFCFIHFFFLGTVLCIFLLLFFLGGTLLRTFFIYLFIFFMGQIF